MDCLHYQALNYQEKRDADTYYKGCQSLEGDPYDGTKLKDFLARLQAKASQFGWDQILTVQNRNLLDDYGVITREEVLQRGWSQPHDPRRRHAHSRVLVAVQDQTRYQRAATKDPRITEKEGRED